jgi:hypothetical protein
MRETFNLKPQATTFYEIFDTWQSKPQVFFNIDACEAMQEGEIHALYSGSFSFNRTSLIPSRSKLITIV